MVAGVSGLGCLFYLCRVCVGMGMDVGMVCVCVSVWVLVCACICLCRCGGCVRASVWVIGMDVGMLVCLCGC